MTTVSLSPPNAILFVFDPSNAAIQVPEHVPGQLVASNGSCVSVGTQSYVDGECEVSLEAAEVNQADGLSKCYDGVVDTPGCSIAVSTAELDVVLQQSVKGTTARISIWTDDSRNPARLRVVAI